MGALKHLEKLKALRSAGTSRAQCLLAQFLESIGGGSILFSRPNETTEPPANRGSFHRRSGGSHQSKGFCRAMGSGL